MKTNVKARGTGPRTFEGGPASPQKPLEALRRSLMTCLLWEDTFYEDGIEIATRIKGLVKDCVKEGQAKEVTQLALEAKYENKLRHAPLWVLVALFEAGAGTARLVHDLVGRADEPAELLALWWKDGRRPIPKQMKLGLASALTKFDAYQLAKYDRDGDVKLRDVFRLVRPKPSTPEQSNLWKMAVARTLPTPKTWETELSSGKDKKDAWTSLILGRQLGDLAFLRNLRNMTQAGVPTTVVRDGFTGRSWAKILPFQMVTAATHAPEFMDELQAAFLAAAADLPKIEGQVRILVDQSGSMSAAISAKGEVDRAKAAGTLAAILREMAQDVEIFAFNREVLRVPPYHGFPLVERLSNSEGGTRMWSAIRATAQKRARLVLVITDEQTEDSGKLEDANTDLLVIVNVAPYQYGVAYGKGVVHVSGWSEGVARFVAALLSE